MAEQRHRQLLLVDDEDNLRSMLQAALRHMGYDVRAAGSGRDALAAVREQQPDLVVLDVRMPDMDGFEVCARLRRDGSPVPILFLTASDETQDKVRGLTLGGDDYLVKPFSLEELVARIEAILRRAGIEHRPATLTCADLVMDDDAHRVTRAGRDLALSPTEYNLLHYLLTNRGRVVSKTQILERVWHYDFGGNGRIVETYIGYLRRKLDGDPGDGGDGGDAAPLIHTIRGVGYTLREPS